MRQDSASRKWFRNEFTTAEATMTEVRYQESLAVLLAGYGCGLLICDRKTCQLTVERVSSGAESALSEAIKQHSTLDLWVNADYSTAYANSRSPTSVPPVQGLFRIMGVLRDRRSYRILGVGEHFRMTVLWVATSASEEAMQNEQRTSVAADPYTVDAFRRLGPTELR